MCVKSVWIPININLLQKERVQFLVGTESFEHSSVKVKEISFNFSFQMKLISKRVKNGGFLSAPGGLQVPIN